MPVLLRSRQGPQQELMNDPMKPLKQHRSICTAIGLQSARGDREEVRQKPSCLRGLLPTLQITKNCPQVHAEQMPRAAPTEWCSRPTFLALPMETRAKCLHK